MNNPGPRLNQVHRILSAWFLCLLFGTLSAQETDTVLARLKDFSHDTLRAKWLARAAYSFRNTDSSLAFKYAREIQKLPLESSDQKIRIIRHLTFAEIHYAHQDYRNASEEYLQGALGALKVGQLKKAGMCFQVLGKIHGLLGKLSDATTYFLLADSLAEKSGNRVGIAYACFGLGDVYRQQNNLDRAMKYFLRAQEICESMNDERGRISALINLSVLASIQRDYTGAIRYSEKGLKICEEAGLREHRAHFLDQIGGYHSMLGQYKKALEYLLQALQAARNSGDKMREAEVLNSLGTNYNKTKEYETAQKYFEEALVVSKQTGPEVLIANIHKNLAAANAGVGQYQTAYENCMQSSVKQDSIFSVSSAQQVAEMETRYSTEKKIVENKLLSAKLEISEAELKRRNLIIASLGMILILFGLSIYFYYRSRRLAYRYKTVELEQKLLRSQMNPHFIFNALQAIQNFMLRHDGKEAVKYLSSFANVTRAVLESSRLDAIALKKELKLLENYLELQKLRFGERFTYQITVAEDIDTENISVPPMLFQPFIENAIEHGMHNIESGGKIVVNYKLRDEFLTMEITDNGKGLAQTVSLEKQHASRALEITKERVELLNRSAKSKTSFRIQDAFPEDHERKGVRVIFTIPVRLAA